MSSSSHNNTVPSGWFEKQAFIFEEKRFFWMSVVMILQSCYASAAAGLILANGSNMTLLLTSAATAMACNAACIAQVSGKVCLITFYLSLIANSIFLFMFI
ncbi:MAG: hypothetical protein IT237_13745 [Bacteroidia bacterium]|nr:hypothetical protein [Bacteroidia bacterium]